MDAGFDTNELEPPLQNSPESKLAARVKRALLGAPRNIKDPGVFHKISLIAFLAWVGLGADGLSSSAYGPDEAFRALGNHTYLALGLAAATAFTVFIISYAYSRIIEQFPFGGGGYVVASKLLGPKFGVVSGSALLVDYVLTISVSIASGADQVFSFLPQHYAQYKLIVVAIVIGGLTMLNLRGVKESVTVLMPIFMVFIVSHAALIVGGIATHAFNAHPVVEQISSGYSQDMKLLGLGGMFAIFLHAYSMGAGTYTGIEAVSNGIQIMREPKIATARRTMLYMAISLAVTAGGILLLYLLFHVAPEAGKTMNAVLAERFVEGWSLGTIPIGRIFIIIILASEAALLFVAAQAGFIDGPRVMSNMSIDSWLPHRFTSLSDRLTMQNGVVLIALAALATLYLTHGDTSTLVLMYSINVFLTFSLSEAGMVRYWIQSRAKHPDWWRHISIHVIGLVLCVSILVVSLIEKFAVGGWITLVITGILIWFCIGIKNHYKRVYGYLGRLDEILENIPTGTHEEIPSINKNGQTAVLLVNKYGGLGIHSFLTIQRLFPHNFKNFLFVSIDVIDAGTLKGLEDVDESIKETEDALKKYVDLANRLGFAAAYKMGVGTEVLDEAEKVCLEISKEYPHSIFFAGKLVFERERWFQRLLHNETATQFQRRLQFNGMNAMVLPVRIFAKSQSS